MVQFTVLGASGFIGSCVATRLTEIGYEVLRPNRDALRSLAGHELGHIVYCLGVDDAPDNPFGAFEAHVGHLVGLLRSSNFSSLTYLSSTRVYFGAKSSREDADLIIVREDANAIYNVTKIAGEQICLTVKKPTIRVIRLSNVIGLAPRGTSLIPTLIKNAIQDRKMHLTISPHSVKDYVAVGDVVSLLPRIALEGRHRCYNLASGMNLSSR